MKKQNSNLFSTPGEFQPVFPIEFNHEILPVNPVFPGLEFSIIDETGEKFSVSVKVPEILHNINILLLIDGKKYDIYFNVSAGEYVFRNIFKHKFVRSISFLYFNRIVKSEEQIIMGKGNEAS